jgi:hypothetical protein
LLPPYIEEELKSNLWVPFDRAPRAVITHYGTEENVVHKTAELELYSKFLSF